MKNDEFFYCFAVQKRPFCPEKLTVLPLRTVPARKVQVRRRGKMKPRVRNLPKYRVFRAASHLHMPSRRGKNSYGANVSIRSRINYRQAEKSVIFTIVHKNSHYRCCIRRVCRLSPVKQSRNPWDFIASSGIFCPYAAVFCPFRRQILCHSLHSVTASGQRILFCGIRPNNRTVFCMRSPAKLDFSRHFLYNVTQIK